MSKVDAQRALRDARYARFAAAKKNEAAAAKKPPAKAPATKAAPKAPSASAAAEPVPELFSSAGETAVPGQSPADAPVTTAKAAEAAEPEPEAALGEELCGHRSMNGRSCTRSKGHPQKNHRYN